MDAIIPNLQMKTWEKQLFILKLFPSSDNLFSYIQEQGFFQST